MVELNTQASTSAPKSRDARPAPNRLTGRLRAALSIRMAAATIGVTAALVLLFLQYLRIARSAGTNADGASNAIQAWDMLHGNVLLHGWITSDVPFYTTELLQHALVELIVGYHADVVHVAAAMTYTMLIVLAAVLAKGRATGLSGVVRMGVAVAFLLAPSAGAGQLIVLSNPNHTGTGVPLLVTWIVLDRALTRRDGTLQESAPRWLPYVIAGLLVWGQIGDPLVAFIGALPLIVVCAVRLWRTAGHRPHRWRGPDARLLVAAVASILVAQAVLVAVRLAGGFYAIPAELKFAPLGQLGHRIWRTGTSIAVVFGGYLPEKDTPAEVALGLLHIVGLLVVFAAVAAVVFRALRRPAPSTGAVESDLVNQVLVAGILLNIAAYVVSTLPVDLGGGREIVAILPFGGALVARVFVSRLRPVRVVPVLAAVLVTLAVALVAQPWPRVGAAENQDVADWLLARGLATGVGSYWSSNNITLATSGRVLVIPLTGGAPVLAYRRESRTDWYDPARYDARFVVVDTRDPAGHVLESAISQFGPPLERHDFIGAVVLVYHHNLLVGLPAYCVHRIAPSLAEC